MKNNAQKVIIRRKSRPISYQLSDLYKKLNGMVGTEERIIIEEIIKLNKQKDLRMKDIITKLRDRKVRQKKDSQDDDVQKAIYESGLKKKNDKLLEINNGLKTEINDKLEDIVNMNMGYKRMKKTIKSIRDKCESRRIRKIDNLKERIINICDEYECEICREPYYDCECWKRYTSKYLRKRQFS